MNQIPKILHLELERSPKPLNRIRKLVTCAQCGEEFRARNKNSKYCSMKCKAEARRKIPLSELPRIIELWTQGWTWVRLGELYNVHPNSVRRIVLQHFERSKR